MHTISLKNTDTLQDFLDSKGYIYETELDGMFVLLHFHKREDIFQIGIMYGQYLVNNPKLVTIKELEQRGDIPGY